MDWQLAGGTEAGWMGCASRSQTPVVALMRHRQHGLRRQRYCSAAPLDSIYYIPEGRGTVAFSAIFATEPRALQRDCLTSRHYRPETSSRVLVLQLRWGPRAASIYPDRMLCTCVTLQGIRADLQSGEALNNRPFAEAGQSRSMAFDARFVTIVACWQGKPSMAFKSKCKTPRSTSEHSSTNGPLLKPLRGFGVRA